ncbi:MAG: BamA/TamA family outer membrane protein [Muribaculaceae bacterium]|nr:BamA/TamA family outer membrane protein [Muribaculaceae bacterium]
MQIKFITLFVFLSGFLQVSAAESSDSITVVAQQDTLKKRPGLFTRIINYFGDANKEKPEKKFDVNFIGGPYYSSDMKLGLGLVGAGMYRMNGCSKEMQPSNVSLFGSVSTVGFYMLGIRGNNLFPKDRYRLNYSMSFYSFPSYFWGIGFYQGNNDVNKTKIKRFQSKLKAEFLFRLGKEFYLGPVLVWDYARAQDVNKDYMYLFDGMSLVQRNYGVGASVQYDTRDFISNASRGIYAYLSQTFRPSWLGNDQAFSTTEFQLRGYKSVWKGGILAGELKGMFNFGNPSWAMMAELGGSNSMRGYYEGRYRDKHSMSVQVELRQHVWRRNGITVWAGAGNVFHDSRTFKKILPNFGIGYRWEFKKRVNVRLDLGFGKSGQNGFIFNINEAF